MTPIKALRMRNPSAAGGAINPAFANVAFLHGYNASTTGWETEESSYAASGTPHTATGDPATCFPVATGGLFGAKCLNIDGGYVGYADAGQYELGADPFTYEMWVRFASGHAPVTNFHFLGGKWQISGGQGSYALSVDSNVLTFYRTADGSSQSNITGAWTPSVDTWYHVAVCFDGTKTRLFVDGAMVGSSTTPVTFYNSTADFMVGAIANGGSVNSNFVGKLEEVRLCKEALYTSDAGFTPPTAAFARS
jgi:hypothetical protein